jgi:hypothetical protein
MRIYRCKLQYLSNLLDEPPPSWPQDYAEPENMVPQETGRRRWNTHSGSATLWAGIWG